MFNREHHRRVVVRIQAPICRDIIGVRIGEAGEGGLNRPELSISCFDLADTRASGVLAESSVRRLSFRAVRAGKRIDRFIGWEPFHREAFGAWKAPTTFMPCIGIPNLESALLLLVILLLLSAVRLRVGLRVRVRTGNQPTWGVLPIFVPTAFCFNKRVFSTGLEKTETN